MKKMEEIQVHLDSIHLEFLSIDKVLFFKVIDKVLFFAPFMYMPYLDNFVHPY